MVMLCWQRSWTAYSPANKNNNNKNQKKKNKKKKNTSYIFTVEEHDLRCILAAVNPRKAAGPKCVTSKVLTFCVDQLTGVFTKIFILFLALSHSAWSPQTSLNDIHPAALTPVIMKCFEKLFRSRVIQGLPPTGDSHNFRTQLWPVWNTRTAVPDLFSLTLARHSTHSHL